MPKKGAEKALRELVSWQGGNEIDSYYYFKNFFSLIFDYAKDKIRINNTSFHGFPDITLYSKDGVPWIVGEVKPEPGFFRDASNRLNVWNTQLRRYVTADTVYALLLDPITIVVVSPDGKIGIPFLLENINVRNITDPSSPVGLTFLAYDQSIGPVALQGFVAGKSPMHYLDVAKQEDREAFYVALRASATELRNYAMERVQAQFKAYDLYKQKIEALGEAPTGETTRILEQRHALETEYRDSILLREKVIKYFLAQIGREVPPKQEDEIKFVQKVYSTEASNLYLARILFVRFFEDYDMTTRKISNGGIVRFQEFHRYVKDDYRYLLDTAFRDMKFIYARLFDESVFDWAHQGNGQLSQILLRIFYRLNAFDFTKITGDILGNLYERFLDPDSRKEMGEFYTPEFVADYILQSIGFVDEPGPILDPSCGSGTFLFRALETAIQKLREKGIPYKDAIENSVNLIHGLDINVFAAFIAQLQVIWHLLPHLRQAGVKKIPDLKIYGGLDSLEIANQSSFDQNFITPHENEGIRIRESGYKYVVGNPPYIRAERMKTPTRWSTYYKAVATGKKDASAYFLYRAIEGGMAKPWLNEKGKMGFIVSFGLANSKAAGSLREVLLQHHLLLLVDLEPLSNEVFTSGIATSRSTVAPIIMIEENSVSRSNEYQVKIATASRVDCIQNDEIDLRKSSISDVSKSVFTDTSINPFRQFVTKLKPFDILLLRKLFSNTNLSQFAAPVNKQRTALQIGVQTGTGKGKISSETGSGKFPMVKGSHIHAFVLNESKVGEYVDYSKIENLSLWRYPSLVSRPAYAIAELGFAPQACKIDAKKFIAQKSCIVFIPRQDKESFPWDAYLNSRVVRYIFGLVLRSGLFEGSDDLWRATINADAMKVLPVPKRIFDHEDELLQLTMELRKLGERILGRWQKIDDEIESSDKIPIALIPDVRYENVDDFGIFRKLPVRYSEENGIARLNPVWRNTVLLPTIIGDREALQMITYLMNHPEFRLTPAPSSEIPKDYKRLAGDIFNADVQVNPDIQKFISIMAEIDKIIAEAFSLTDKEFKYIIDRLDSSVFSTMQPRWPWVPAAIRTTRVYEDDRYA